MSQQATTPAGPRVSLGGVVKGLLVALALVVFSATIFLLWAFQTGRAVEYVRGELLAQLQTECGVEGRFTGIELGVFPPQVSLEGVALEGSDGGELVSVEKAILRIAVLPLFYGRIQLVQVAALSPKAKLVIDDGKLVNMPACIQPSSASAAPIPVLGFDDLVVERGQLTLEIPKLLTAQLDDIGITMFPAASGGTDITVGVDDGHVMLKDREIVVDRFRLLGHIAGLLTEPRALTVQSMQVALTGVNADVSGSIDLLGPVLEVTAEIEADLADLEKTWEGLPDMSGSVRLKTSLVGNLFKPRAIGSVAIKEGRIDVYKLGDAADIEFAANQKGVDLTKISVRSGDGEVSGTGRIDIDDARKFPTRAELDIKDLSVARVVEAFGLDGPWVDNRASGKLVGRGTILDPTKFTGNIEFVSRDFHVFDRAWNSPALRSSGGVIASEKVLLALGPTNVEGRWSIDTEGITVHEANLQRGGTAVNARARFSFEQAKGLLIEGQLSNFDFNDIGPVAGLLMAGRGEMSARFKGPYASIAAIGNFELTETAVGGIPFGEGSGTVAWSGEVIDIRSIEGLLGQSHYNGDVVVDLSDGARLSIAGAVPRGRIEDLLVPFHQRADDWGHPKGDMSATFDLQGRVDALTGPIDLELKDIVVLEEIAKSGRIIGRMESGMLIAESAEIDKYGARIAGSGYVDPKSGAVRARVHTRGLRLQHVDMLRRSTEQIDGDLAVHVDLAGSLHGLTGTVTGALAGVHAGTMKLGDGTMLGKVRGADMFVTGTMLQDKLQIDGKVRIDSGLPYDTGLRLDTFDAPQLVGMLSDNPLWRGSVKGTAKLSGSLVRWEKSNGELFIERGVFEAPSIRLETSAPVRLTLDDGIFETKRIALIGPTSRLSASGKLGRVMDLAIHGRIDLGIVEAAFDPVERSSGSLQVDAAVRGTPSQLDLVGTGKVEHGAVEWRGLQSKLTAVTADLTFSQSTVIVERVEGRLDGGRATASGQVLLDGYKPSRIQIETELTSVRPKFSNPKFDLSGVISGKIALEGRPDHLVMRGQLSARRATIWPKFDWRNIVGDPLQRLAPKVYDPTAEILYFDIGVHLEEPLRMKNDTADVRLAGDVTMTGTNQRIGLIGALSVLDGRVGFLGRTYHFERGTMDLQDRFRFFPRYDLHLRANACGAQINLNLVGTLDEFATVYASKPEMDDTNIVSCLVSGVKIRDLETIRDEAIGGAAASFAGEALWRLSGVDRQVKKVLPVDEIDVTTEYSDRERVYEPRLLIAKEIIDGKVRLEYSTSLFNTEDQSISARYRVTPDLTFQTGWRSSEDIATGDLGVDLKYRWEW